MSTRKKTASDRIADLVREHGSVFGARHCDPLAAALYWKRLRWVAEKHFADLGNTDNDAAYNYWLDALNEGTEGHRAALLSAPWTLDRAAREFAEHRVGMIRRLLRDAAEGRAVPALGRAA